VYTRALTIVDFTIDSCIIEQTIHNTEKNKETKSGPMSEIWGAQVAWYEMTNDFRMYKGAFFGRVFAHFLSLLKHPFLHLSTFKSCIVVS